MGAVQEDANMQEKLDDYLHLHLENGNGCILAPTHCSNINISFFLHLTYRSKSRSTTFAIVIFEGKYQNL